MKHTKKSDQAAIQRVKTLGARSLNPDDFTDLERITEYIQESVYGRVQDEQEDPE